MKIYWLLLGVLFLPQTVLAITAGYNDKDTITNLEKDYSIQVSHDKQTAEAIVFAPLISFIKTIKDWWNTIYEWFNWKQIHVSLCTLNALTLAKAHVGLAQNGNCP